MSKKSADKAKVWESAIWRTPPNIALVKYWGKFCEKDIIPLNASLSITLNEEDIFTETQVFMSESFDKDQLFLNKSYAPQNLTYFQAQHPSRPEFPGS